MLQTFHFLRPEWLFVLPVLAIILLFLQYRTQRESGWEKVCDPELLKYQLAKQSKQSSSSHLLYWMVPFVLFTCVFALAGPSWEKKDQPIFQQGNALVIILDLSLSMNAKDIKPSRLERAKLKIIDILKQKKEGQTALIAYAGDAHTVSPLTIDNKTIMSLLPALDTSIMPLAGSHIDDALDTAKQLLQNSGFTRGDLLLITDGIDKAEEKQLNKKVKSFYQQGYRFSVIGIGSRSGSPIPLPGQAGFVKDSSGQVILSKLTSKPLQQLTRIGGGAYHDLSLDDSDFKALLDKRLLNRDSVIEQENQLEQWVDAGGYVTLLLLPIALIAFRKGLLSIIIVIIFLPSFMTNPALANEAQVPSTRLKWDDLWFTADQQGQKAFNTQDYQKAAKKFNDSKWKASSYYRNGNFEKALENYAQADDASSLYNKANSLANLQKFEQAINTYNEALKLNPDLKDAESNRDYLKDLLSQQAQQQSDQNSQPQQNADNQQKSQEQSQQQSQEQNDSEDSQQSEQNDKNPSGESGQESEQQDSPESDNDDSGKKPQDAEQNNDNTDPQSNEPKSPEPIQQTSDNEESESKEMSPQEQQAKQSEQETEQGEAAMQADDILSQLSQEEQQSLKQWLQRIPDNPGELLRIKFRNNTLLKQRQKQAPAQYEGNPW